MIARALETWFAKAKRPMPWRVKPAPYVCWLSEILMQQTTYAAVLPYYERFLKKFPTVEKLAAAEEAEVLKAWEGLGYYARARNLLKAARTIVDGAASGEAASRRLKKGARVLWPKASAEWAVLPGIGPYTAAALASVLNGERIPVVDGNVARVFARYWLLADDFRRQPARARLAARLRLEIAKAKVPGDFNQAMMELGALVCTPTSPDCGVCPLAKGCAARKAGAQEDYPVRAGKKALPVRQSTAIVVRDGKGRVLLVQNREGGLLKGLWELPTVGTGPAATQVFSHFKQELSSFCALRSDAEFHDPGSVPLTTMTRKLLAQSIPPLPRTNLSDKLVRTLCLPRHPPLPRTNLSDKLGIVQK